MSVIEENMCWVFKSTESFSPKGKKTRILRNTCLICCLCSVEVFMYLWDQWRLRFTKIPFNLYSNCSDKIEFKAPRSV